MTGRSGRRPTADALSAWLTRHARPEPGDLVIPAVSGGVDSVALLHLLHAAAPSLGLSLEVAHVHHGLRPDADADAEFVAGLAAGLGLRCHIRRVDVASERSRRRAGLQEAARAARHAALAELAAQRGALAIALAHHLDDQAETVLMRLARGTGLEGLAAMAPVRPADGPRPLWIRPLLEFARGDLVEYCRANGLAWREDPSNADRRFRRARVRLDVMPALEAALGPGVARRIARTADALREDGRYLRELGQRALRDALLLDAPGRVELSVDALRRAPEPLRRRALRLAFARASSAPFETATELGTAGIERLAGLLRPESSGVLNLPGWWTARRIEGRLILQRRARPARPPTGTTAVPVPGRLHLPKLGGVLTARLEAGAPAAEVGAAAGGTTTVGTASDEYTVAFDWRLVQGTGPLGIRAWRAGDRILLPNTPAPRRVARVLMHRRVPREKRALTPVVVAGDTVIWAVGAATSAAVAASGTTQERLVLTWSTRPDKT